MVIGRRPFPCAFASGGHAALLSIRGNIATRPEANDVYQVFLGRRTHVGSNRTLAPVYLGREGQLFLQGATGAQTPSRRCATYGPGRPVLCACRRDNAGGLELDRALPADARTLLAGSGLVHPGKKRRGLGVEALSGRGRSERQGAAAPGGVEAAGSRGAASPDWRGVSRLR